MVAFEPSAIVQVLNSVFAGIALVVGAVAVALHRRSRAGSDWQSARTREQLQADEQEHDHWREFLKDVQEHLRSMREREAELFGRLAQVELKEEQCRREQNRLTRWAHAMAHYSIKMNRMVEELGGKADPPPDPPPLPQ